MKTEVINMFVAWAVFHFAILLGRILLEKNKKICKARIRMYLGGLACFTASVALVAFAVAVTQSEWVHWLDSFGPSTLLGAIVSVLIVVVMVIWGFMIMNFIFGHFDMAFSWAVPEDEFDSLLRGSITPRLILEGLKRASPHG